MYALVFDNTFSKQLSKTVTFVLLTYPTASPPQSNYHLLRDQDRAGTTSTNVPSSVSHRERMSQGGSSESVQKINTGLLEGTNGAEDSRQRKAEKTRYNKTSNYFTGVLQKRRRKRHQGYARRFFSLDFSSSTLSYYHNRGTTTLRGAIPLSLAAIGANSKSREISIDSGAEIWHLKAHNMKDFEAWKNALELAKLPYSPASPALNEIGNATGRVFPSAQPNPEEEREWTKVETLVNRIQESRETAWIMAKDTDPKYLPLSVPKFPFERNSTASSTSESPSEQSFGSGLQERERRPFWKRKASGEKSASMAQKRSVSAQPTTTPSMSTPSTPSALATNVAEIPSLASHAEESLHDHCMSLLSQLDTVVSEFAVLIEESKQRRLRTRPLPVSSTSRYSLDSLRSQEFFDAESQVNSQLLAIQHETDEEEVKSEDPRSDDDSASEVEGDTNLNVGDSPEAVATSSFPPRPSSLAPLPAHWVKRRDTLPMPSVNPPSLIGFFRKNVGKDLSTISMPVSSNEPLSLLQRASEQLEYSHLLDSAANPSQSTNMRLLYISAFAISNLSSSRIKERSTRKPFNPMLGETFELVREDRGFRFVAEKVSHRPVRMACQGESEKWTFAQSPMPSQKFWGKSAEVVTEGRARVVLHSTGDRFSWSPATSFLRNIIAGEKYVEPVGSMTITNEANGEHAIVTFKTGGMFSGRSEDVVVQSFDSYGDSLPLGLVGKWTSSLAISENGTPKHSEPPIWTVAELVPDAPKRYGFTAFAASLNEITAMEKNKIPPTDSRLRPDQRAAENNDFDTAEGLKVKLEEAQRKRRKVMEEEGRQWEPRWFSKVEGLESGEETWRLKTGPEGYWEKRSRGAWAGLERVFND